MILADTSVWIEHFRRGLPEFAQALSTSRISIHPIVVGELATGNLTKRTQTLAALRRLPTSQIGTFDECLQFLESRAFYGRGIGWNDLQLLVAARLSRHWLWSLDPRLAAAATASGVAYAPS